MINNVLEIMEQMNIIEYGWVDINNNKYNVFDERFSDDYILQSPNEVIKNKIGICWDQVELERFYFEKNNFNVETYFLVHYDNDKCPTHTFLIFQNNDKYYWFEHSWKRFRGIHEYKTLKELLFDVRDKFIKYELNNQYSIDNIMLYKYKKPEYHITVEEFYNHCENGEYINY